LRSAPAIAICCLSLATALAAQTVTVPATIEAGNAFRVTTTGSGQAKLYIAGPEQVLKRDVQLGESMEIPAGSLYNAGHYIVVVSGASSSTAEFDVLPAAQPASVSFLARPSRLQAGLHNGITGAAYVFDTYGNLVLAPQQVSFELTSPNGAQQKREVQTHQGAAWIAMDSTTQQGADKFVARVGDIASTRIVTQVPGDPCGLKMNVHPAGQVLQLETDPVKDCSGNAVPDGTIVTFTETYNGDKSTVDVPLKRGVAKVEMPAVRGAIITVASGVALGNQVRWEK
jgi:hypothetical protein